MADRDESWKLSRRHYPGQAARRWRGGRALAQCGDRRGSVRCGSERAIEPLGTAAGGNQRRKPKYADESGVPFQCRLIEWRADKRYSPQEIVDRLQLQLAPAGRPKKTAKTPTGSASQSIGADDVLTPKAAENPVVAALKARGLYKTPLGSGKHDVTCPWVHEHTDELDTGAAYFEPDELYPVGGFCCQHSHRDKYHIRPRLES